MLESLVPNLLLAFRNRTGLADNRTLILEKEDWYTAGVDGDTTLVNHIPLLFGEMHNSFCASSGRDPGLE